MPLGKPEHPEAMKRLPSKDKASKGEGRGTTRKSNLLSNNYRRVYLGSNTWVLGSDEGSIKEGSPG